MPVAGALFGVPIDRAQQRVDIDVRLLLDTGQQVGPAGAEAEASLTFLGRFSAFFFFSVGGTFAAGSAATAVSVVGSIGC